METGFRALVLCAGRRGKTQGRASEQCTALRPLWNWTWFYVPDLGCVFGNSAIAGELP